MNFLNKQKGAMGVGALIPVVIMAVVGLLLIQNFITAGNFQGTVGTIADLIPLAFVGLIVVLVVAGYAFMTR